MQNIDIIIEKQVDERIDNEVVHYSCDFLLKIANEYFDPEIDLEHTESLSQYLSERYWSFLSGLWPKAHTLFVKLSGLDFDIEDLLTELSVLKEKTNHLILHDEVWDRDEETYLFVECDEKLFKGLFERYWFCIGVEYHFQGIFLPSENIIHIKKWSQSEGTASKENDLLKISYLIFDNQVCGFYFQLASDKKDSRFFEALEL